MLCTKVLLMGEKERTAFFATAALPSSPLLPSLDCAPHSSIATFHLLSPIAFNAMVPVLRSRTLSLIGQLVADFWSSPSFPLSSGAKILCTLIWDLLTAVTYFWLGLAPFPLSGRMTHPASGSARTLKAGIFSGKGGGGKKEQPALCSLLAPLPFSASKNSNLH